MTNKSNISLCYDGAGCWKISLTIEEHWDNKNDAMERCRELMKEMIGRNIRIEVDL